MERLYALRLPGSKTFYVTIKEDGELLIAHFDHDEESAKDYLGVDDSTHFESYYADCCPDGYTILWVSNFNEEYQRNMKFKIAIDTFLSNF